MVSAHGSVGRRGRKKQQHPRTRPLRAQPQPHRLGSRALRHCDRGRRGAPSSRAGPAVVRHRQRGWGARVHEPGHRRSPQGTHVGGPGGHRPRSVPVLEAGHGPARVRGLRSGRGTGRRSKRRGSRVGRRWAERSCVPGTGCAARAQPRRIGEVEVHTRRLSHNRIRSTLGVHSQPTAILHLPAGRRRDRA